MNLLLPLLSPQQRCDELPLSPEERLSEWWARVCDCPSTGHGFRGWRTSTGQGLQVWPLHAVISPQRLPFRGAFPLSPPDPYA